MSKYPWGDDLYGCPNPLYVSNSSLGTFHSCVRKFFFSKILTGRREAPSLASELGHALHIGWQTWLETESRELSDWAYARRYPLLLNSDPTDGRSLEAGLSALDEIRNNIKMAEWKLASIVDMYGNTRPAVEVEFELWIDGPLVGGRAVVYRGFIDAILQHVVTGEFLIVDLKTTRTEDQNVAAEYKWNDQGLPYGLILQAATGKPVTNFTIAYLCTYVDIVDPRCVFYPVDKKEQDVNDWVQAFWLDIMQLRNYAAMEFWPRTAKSCMAYKHPCRFFGICEETRPQVLEAVIAAMPEPIGVDHSKEDKKPWVRYQLQLPERLPQ